MEKIFRQTLIMKHELSYLIHSTSYYQHSVDDSLMISDVCTNGGEHRTLESGEMSGWDGPEYSLDPIVRAYTLDDCIRVTKQEIAEEGYVEISEEEFMQIVNEKYPGWREKEPEPELKPSELAKRRLAARHAEWRAEGRE